MSKIQGTVKWFSNRKGFGFITPTSENSPTKDDIFVHQSNIVTEAEYRTLKDGFEVEFETTTDESGKLRAQNVTSVGGGPCPGPEPRERNRRRRNNRKDGNETNDEGDGEENGNAESGGDGEKPEGGGSNRNNKNKNRRRRKPNGRKNDEGGEGRQQQQPREPRPPKKSWFTDLDKEVQESLQSRDVKIDSGRAFVSIGDARIKLGTGGYTALTHGNAIIAEGTFTCDNEGNVSTTWEHVLKFADDEWKPSTVEAESEILVTSFKLADVGPIGSDETAEKLWGEGKADPKDALEANGFKMRKVVLVPTPGGRRGRGRRYGGGGRGGGGGSAPAPAPAEAAAKSE